MSMEDADAKQPKSVILHHIDPIKNFQLKLGVIDYNYEYDHFFLATNGFMDLIGEFNVWLDDVKTYKLPKDNRGGQNFTIPSELNPEIVAELKQIWFGHCYLFQRRNKKQEITVQNVIFNPNIDLQYNENIIQLPALMHMNPRSRTKDDTNPKVLIQEPIPFDIAYDGYDPDQLAQVFGFKYDYADGEVYMFNNDAEVMTSDALTMEISREVYHKLIRILILEYKPRKDKVYYQVSKILSSYNFVNNMRQLETVGGEADYVV